MLRWSHHLYGCAVALGGRTSRAVECFTVLNIFRKFLFENTKKRKPKPKIFSSLDHFEIFVGAMLYLQHLYQQKYFFSIPTFLYGHMCRPDGSEIKPDEFHCFFIIPQNTTSGRL